MLKIHVTRMTRTHNIILSNQAQDERRDPLLTGLYALREQLLKSNGKWILLFNLCVASVALYVLVHVIYVC